jgi:hypothetical protein
MIAQTAETSVASVSGWAGAWVCPDGVTTVSTDILEATAYMALFGVRSVPDLYRLYGLCTIFMC